MTKAIQTAVEKKQQAMAAPKQQGLNEALNSFLDQNMLRKRFEEILGKRTPQFISSLISTINGEPTLQQAFREAPMTVVQSALKAATLDLPIEPSLGFAYIIAFKNNKKMPDGSWRKVCEANFVPGYKGLTQLALRTGAYARIPDAIDVREGELINYDRLTGDCEFKWIEDEDVREKLPIIGYAGYFRLKNGAEKTLYMTRKQIEAHEKKNRKGEQMGKGWRESWEDMARKTVIRRLISKYGLMSITYQGGDAETVVLANEVLYNDAPELPEEAPIEVTEYTESPAVDAGTGEVIEDDQGDAVLPWENKE